MTPLSQTPDIKPCSYLDSYAVIASTPELAGLDPLSDEGIGLVDLALTRHEALRGRDNGIAARMIAGMLFEEEMVKPYDDLPFVAEVDSWYRSLGSTNDLTGAEPVILSTADTLERISRVDGETADMAALMAGDLFYELAMQYEGVDPERFGAYYGSAIAGLQGFVKNPVTGKSRCVEAATQSSEKLTPEHASELAQATYRYHDLRFLGLHSSLSKVLDTPDPHGVNADAIIQEYVNRQSLALADFEASLIFAKNKTRYAPPLLSQADMYGNFRVLAERNAQMRDRSPAEMLFRLSEKTMRNATPREYNPMDEFPEPYPTTKISSVVTHYDEEGLIIARERLRAGLDTDDRLELVEIDTLPLRDSSSGQIDTRHLLVWTRQLQEELRFPTRDTAARETPRNCKSPLPFDYYL